MRRIYTFIVFTLLLSSLVSCSRQKDSEIFLVAGSGKAGFKDGVGKEAELNKPIRLAPFGENTIVLADINNNAIRSVSWDGSVRTICGGPDKSGYMDGPAEEAKLNAPHGVAYDKQTGKIYVAEAGNHIIRMLTPIDQNHSEYEISTLAGVAGQAGFRDGPADSALFMSPHGLVLFGSDSIIIADIGNARIRLLHKGVVSTLAGSGEIGTKDGTPLEASFKYPMDIVRFSSDILIADAGTHLIRKLDLGNTVSTVNLQDTLSTPHGITVDGNGKIYIADMGTNRILAVDKAGSLHIKAGTGKNKNSTDILNKPAAVLVHSGYLWIADLNNHQIKAIKLAD